MVTFAQAQERAEEWINGDVPAYQHREVRVREFELGFVVWAEDREAGPVSEGGRQRLVIARDSGDASLWPALPVGEVIRRYEEEYGLPDASAVSPAPRPPERVDLNQTSFLLTPPEWLQEAADAAAVADAEPVASEGTRKLVRPKAGPRDAVPAEAGRRGAEPQDAVPQDAVPVVPPGVTPWAGTDTNGIGDDEDRSVPLPDTVFSPPLAEDAPPPGVTPDSETERLPNGSALPATAGFDALEKGRPGGSSYGYPQGAGGASQGGSSYGYPQGAAGASFPPPTPGTAVPGPPPPGASYGYPQEGRDASGRPLAPEAGDIANAATSKAGPPRAGAPTPPPPGPPGAPAGGYVPTRMVQAPGPGGQPGAPQPPGAPGAAGQPASATSSGELGVPGAPPSAGSGGASGAPGRPGAPGQPPQPGASAPGGPGASGAPERPGPPAPPGAPGTPGASTPPGPPRTPPPPGPPGVPAPPGATPPSGEGVHHAATMLSGPTPGGPGGQAPPPPAPPGAPGGGQTPPPGEGVHHAATMLTGPRPQGPGTPPPPGAPGAPGAPGGGHTPPPGEGMHHAATMLSGPGPQGPGPATPPPPGAPGAPGGGPTPPGTPPPPGAPGTPGAGHVPPPGAPGAMPPHAHTPPPGTHTPPGAMPPAAYGYPQPAPQAQVAVGSGQPTVGPGYQAVLRYRAPDGAEQQLIRRSAPGTPHPEWQIFHELRGMNVPPDQVLELHTELESCSLPGAYCARMIKEQWPQARITSIAPYGTDHASRQQGMRQLLAHQGELHQVADGPARPAPVRAPLPPAQPAPPVPPEGIAQELAAAFGPGVFRFDQRAVSRQGVPDVVARVLVVAGLPSDFGPFFWAQAQPGRPVPTLAELAQERGVQPASDAGSYLVMGSDFGKALCVQYGTANIVAVPVEAGPDGAPAAPQFVNSGLPEFARSLALLGRMWRLRFGLNQEQAGRWTVDFQAELNAIDQAALGSPDTWWSVLLEQMWDGLL
ncbi:SUKH-4 family immunity protein [Streptomyces sp. BYX5S]